jgi:hypothetical protein
MSTDSSPSGEIVGPLVERSDLVHTAWVVEMIDLGDGPIEVGTDVARSDAGPAPQAVRTLDIEERLLHGYDGCDWWGTTWDLSEGHLVARPICRTRMPWGGVPHQEVIRRVVEGEPLVARGGDRLVLRIEDGAALILRPRGDGASAGALHGSPAR